MRKIIVIAIIISLYSSLCYADTHEAASCTYSAVNTAYNAASNGDTVSVPSGNCSTSNAWSSTLVIEKEITLQGAGIDQTYIGASANGDRPIQIMANNVRITGFTFDCRNKNLSNQGMIMAGSSSVGCSTDLLAADFRIDGNKFVNCTPSPLPSDGVTGWSAITARGYVYGVIDNNTFNNCNGECLDIQSNSTGGNTSSPHSLSRSLAYGQYTNGTIYIENNTWNFTTSINEGDYGAENIIDGNAGSRWVFRYNTINVASDTRLNAAISNHELYYGDDICNASEYGGVGSLLMEIYGNAIYNSGTGSFGMDAFVHQRAGRSLIYNNTIYTNDIGESAIVRLTNMRSMHYDADIANPRGYSGYCHEASGGYTVEGMSFSKTTLNGALGNDSGCPTMTSVSDFPTYGGSIIVGNEQIDYTAISDSQLTPCTRGANNTTRATHSNGSAVNLLIFGQCLEQPTNTYVWGNKTVDDADKNDVQVAGYDLYGQDPESKDYTSYDIKSYAQRPQNWQYRNDGTAYSYTPYDCPHTLTNFAGTCNTSAAGTDGYADNLLTVNKDGTGSGTVTSNVGSINCGATCTHYYGGQTVILSAYAAYGSSFTGWSGTGGCTGTSTCELTMSEAKAATATFDLTGAMVNSHTKGAIVRGGNVR